MMVGVKVKKPTSLFLREKIILWLRWKLKYTLSLPERKVKYIAFGLYWKLCCRKNIKRMFQRCGLKRNGVMLMTHTLAPELLREMNDKIDKMKERSDTWIVSDDDGNFVSKDLMSHRQSFTVEHSRDFSEICTGKEMLAYVEETFGESLKEYYGCDYRILSADMYVTYPCDKKLKASSFSWHIDDHPPGLVKGFIYLNDVNEDNGPFCCLPKTHNMDLKAFTDRSASTDWRFPSDVHEEIHIDPHYVIGKKGTSFLVNANAIHRATSLRENERRVLCFMFLPSMQPADLEFSRSGVVPIANSPDRIHEPVWNCL